MVAYPVSPIERLPASSPGFVTITYLSLTFLSLQKVKKIATSPRTPLMKVKQKISGGFRTEAGARTFVVLRTVMSTARKQGWNILHSLTTNPDFLAHNLRTT